MPRASAALTTAEPPRPSSISGWYLRAGCASTGRGEGSACKPSSVPCVSFPSGGAIRPPDHHLGMPGLRRNVSSRRRTPAGLNGHRGASFWVNMLRPVALRLACGLTLAASWLASAPLAAKPPSKRAEAVQPAPLPSAEESACFDHHELGQELRQAGKLLESRAAFLECAASNCPTAVQRDCERWSREVVAELPKLELAVRFAGKPRNDASVEIDGEPRADALASAVVLDPGLHRYRVRLAGTRGVEGELTLHAGEPTHQLSL